MSAAGMNAEVDEAAEERKGGAGHLGKMLLSAGTKSVRFFGGAGPEFTGLDCSLWLQLVCHTACVTSALDP